jgi:hypothetical protein
MQNRESRREPFLWSRNRDKSTDGCYPYEKTIREFDRFVQLLYVRFVAVQQDGFELLLEVVTADCLRNR